MNECQSVFGPNKEGRQTILLWYKLQGWSHGASDAISFRASM
jgi:hypothetical protein